jgi:hypothetical protein
MVIPSQQCCVQIVQCASESYKLSFTHNSQEGFEDSLEVHSLVYSVLHQVLKQSEVHHNEYNTVSPLYGKIPVVFASKTVNPSTYTGTYVVCGVARWNRYPQYTILIYKYINIYMCVCV